MKAIKEVTEETKTAIRRYLELNEKFRNSYFFTPSQNASMRRGYENKNSFSYKNENDGIELNFEVSCSCKHVYVSKSVVIDNVTTNATALKKFVK